MNVHTRDRHQSHVGRKRFLVDHVLTATIEGIANRCVNALNVNMIDSVTDLFVAREKQSNWSMRNFWMLDQVIC